jgi:hypothetical protein
MASRAPYREGWFIVASQGFHGVLLDSRASSGLSGITLGPERPRH